MALLRVFRIIKYFNVTAIDFYWLLFSFTVRWYQWQFKAHYLHRNFSWLHSHKLKYNFTIIIIIILFYANILKVIFRNNNLALNFLISLWAGNSRIICATISSCFYFQPLVMSNDLRNISAEAKDILLNRWKYFN